MLLSAAVAVVLGSGINFPGATFKWIKLLSIDKVKTIVSTGIDEQQAGNIFRICLSVLTHKQSSQRGPDHYQLTFHLCLLQQRVKIVDGLFECVRRRTKVTTGITGPIVGNAVDSSF